MARTWSSSLSKDFRTALGLAASLSLRGLTKHPNVSPLSNTILITAMSCGENTVDVDETLIVWKESEHVIFETLRETTYFHITFFTNLRYRLLHLGNQTIFFFG